MPPVEHLINKRFMRLSAVMLAFMLFPSWNYAWGLGLGEIRVKSQFDKGFSASIPIFTTEAEADLKINVGTASDYELLQVPRPAFVDALTLSVGDDPDRPGFKAVIVTSAAPISTTSFNLVVRVSSGADSMIENYFLAMDFKKNLSIDLPPPPPNPVVTATPPPNKKPAVTKKVEVKTEPKKSEPEPVKTAQAPAPSKPKKAKQQPTKPAVEPAPAKGNGLDLVKLDDNAENNKVVVRPGITIFHIARSLTPAKENIRKVVAAIYLENRDKFTSGNINNFSAGTVITFKNVNKIAAALSLKDVSSILSGNGKTVETPAEATDAEVTEFMEKWRADWESDSPNLADYYHDNFKSSDGGNKAAWIAFKKQMVQTNQNVKITSDNMRIARAGTLIGAHFEQTFKSDRYSSAGRKKILMRKFASGLKIIGELFVATREEEARNVWSVLISAHDDKESGVKHISDLGETAAFEAGSFTGAPPFQILAGRLNSKNAAADLQKKLIGVGEKGPKVVRFPFSIKLAVFKDKKTSGSFMEQLKKDGYSPFRLGKKSGGKVEYEVYVGAFETKGAAENALTTLAKSGLTPVVAVP